MAFLENAVLPTHHSRQHPQYCCKSEGPSASSLHQRIPHGTAQRVRVRAIRWLRTLVGKAEKQRTQLMSHETERVVALVSLPHLVSTSPPVTGL